MPEKYNSSPFIKKPHDHYFKSVGSILEVALELVKVGLPDKIYQQLDLSVFEISNTTFVDEKLEEHLSDLIYTSQLQKSGKPIRICLLFEHKRKISIRELNLQLVRYIVNILEEDLRQGREDFTLPIPIVIYNGAEVWTPKFLREFYQQLPEEFHRYLMDFEFDAINLNSLTDAQIETLYDSMLVRNIFLAMKHAFDDEFYKNNFQKIFIFASENVRPTVIEMLISLTTSYIIYVSKLKKEDIMQAAQAMPIPVGTQIRTTATNVFEEGWFEGIEKGIEKTILTFMTKKPETSDAQVSELFNLPISRVKKLREMLKPPVQKQRKKSSKKIA